MKTRFCIKRVILKTSLFCFGLSSLFFLSVYSEASTRQSVTLSANESISFLCFKVYGRYTPDMLIELSKINHHVSDWDNPPAGKDIHLLTQKEMDSLVPEKNKDFLVITFLQHPVRIQKKAQTTFTKAKLNMILDSYDHVDVQKGGKTELMMRGGRIIRLDEGSTLCIDDLSKDREKATVTVRFKLFLGRLWGKMLKSGMFKRKEMYVSTPTLVAGVRGTAYDLKLEHDQSTLIKVFEGEVEIYNPLQKTPASDVTTDFKKPHVVVGPQRVEGPHEITQKEWNEILLKQYQQIKVTKEGIGKPLAFDYQKERQTEWIQWNEERDLQLSFDQNREP